MNIVLIISDDQSMLSFAQMPYLQSRPYGNWVTFENAFLSYPLCAPSRATLYSGEYAWLRGVPSNSAQNFDSSNAIGVWLQDAGYTTAFFGKYFNNFPYGSDLLEIPPGWDEWCGGVQWSGTEYKNYELNENGTINFYGTGAANYSTDVLAQRLLTFINNQNGETPFAAIMAVTAPHDAIESAPRHQNISVPPITLPGNFNEADVSDKPAFIQGQSLKSESGMKAKFTKEIRCMRAVDEAINSVIDLLTTKEMLDDTVILFMTDNGFSRGSHRWVGKLLPYEENIRTPLMIRYPGGTERTEAKLVSNIDICPTLCEIAGASPTTAQRGMSLVPLLENQSVSWRDEILITKRSTDGPPRYWGIRTETAKYIEHHTGEIELLDLAVDGLEMESQHNNPAYDSLKDDLAGRLAALKVE